jgi:heat shock protein 4
MDFSEQISRADFAAATEKLLQPLEFMLNQLLSVSQLTLDDIHQVEILGGNSRLPNFQQKLKQITTKDKLGTKLNADESVLSSLMYLPQRALNIETQNRNKWIVSVNTGIL